MPNLKNNYNSSESSSYYSNSDDSDNSSYSSYSNRKKNKHSKRSSSESSFSSRYNDQSSTYDSEHKHNKKTNRKAIIKKPKTAQQKHKKYSDDSSDYSSSDSDKSKKTVDHVNVLGKFLNNKYMVLKQLGDGKFGVAWLSYSVTDEKIVCIKIYHTGKKNSVEAETEINHLKSLRQHNCKFIIKLLDTFIYESDQGKHICLVIPCMATSLYDLVRNGNGLPVKIVRSITQQILVAMHIIHTKSGLVHLDIKPDNIMLEGYSKQTHDFIKKFKKIDLKNLFTMCEKKVQKEMRDEEKDKGKKKKTKIDKHKVQEIIYEKGMKSIIDFLYSDGINTGGSSNAGGVDSKYINNPTICVIDFGSACLNKDRTKYHNRTEYFDTPEDIIGYNVKNFSCDMWAVACTVFELLTGDLLFDTNTEKSDDHSSRSLHLFEMQKLLGPIPNDIIGKSRNASEFFYKNGMLKNHNEMEQFSLVDRLKEKNIDKSHIPKIVDFLLPLLNYYPQKRPTALQAFKHPWLSSR